MTHQPRDLPDFFVFFLVFLGYFPHYRQPSGYGVAICAHTRATPFSRVVVLTRPLHTP